MNNPIMVHLLIFDDGGGFGRVERASLDGKKINELAYQMNGGPDGVGGPYDTISIELEDVDKL